MSELESRTNVAVFCPSFIWPPPSSQFGWSFSWKVKPNVNNLLRLQFLQIHLHRRRPDTNSTKGILMHPGGVLWLIMSSVWCLYVFLNLMTPRSDSPNVSPIEGVNITKRVTLQKCIGITTQDDANCGEMNVRRNATTLLRFTGSCWIVNRCFISFSHSVPTYLFI